MLNRYPFLFAIFCLLASQANGQCKYEIASLTIKDVTCNGDDDGAIYLDIQGTNGSPITIKWLNVPNHPTGDPNPEDLRADMYYLRVVDSAGCVDTLEFLVNEPDPIIAVPNNVTVCEGTTINLLQSVVGGVPGYSYQWTSTAGYQCWGCNNTDVVITQGTDFSVTVTDSNGCSTSQVVTVGANPAIQVTHQSFPEVCGIDGKVYLAPSGGTPPFQFSINGSNYQPSPWLDQLKSGQYMVDVIDAVGCTKQRVVSVADRTTNTGLQPFATRVSCAGAQDGQIFVSINAASVDSFSIDSVLFQAQPYFPGLNGGTYRVYVQDTNGCVQFQQVTVFEPTAPTIQLEGDDLTCYGSDDGQLVAMVSGGSYPVDSFTLNGTTQASPYFHNLPAGSYTLICTDTSGCEYSQIITLNQPPQIVVDSLHQAPATCNGFDDGSFEAFVSGGSGAFTFSLDGVHFGTSAAFDTLAAGTYYLTIKDSTGCETIEIITIDQPPAIHITPYVTPATCYKDRDGEIIVITSGGAIVADFSLNGGDWQISNTFPELPAGVHHIMVRDTFGCEYDAYVEVTEPDAIDISGLVTAVGDLANIDITVIGGNGGFTFEWSTGDTTQNLSGLQGGVYKVTVTDSLGCSDSEIFVVEGTSIPNLPASDLVFVYPNPTQGKVTVDLELTQTKQVVIETLDVVGQVVGITPAQVLRDELVELDLTGLARGIYMLRITIDGEAFVTKVMKE